MTPAERVAERTWSMLGRAKELRARFGEETLTDLLVLDMLSHTHGLAKGFQLELEQTTRLKESQCGADLLVIARHPTGRLFQLALQAKKLFPEEDRYQSFDAVTKSKAQLKTLEQFAQQNSALPLYLLYNHSDTAKVSKHWNCCQPSFDVDQLGCTLVPSRHILQLLCRRAPPYRNFDRAHSVSQSIPWRCVFDCPDAEKKIGQIARRYSWGCEPIEAPWPEWLFRKSGSLLKPEDMDQIRNALTKVGRSPESDEPLYPARLLVVDGARPRATG